MDQSSPPPGWYPDPSGAAGWRWWDGYAWSQATQGINRRASQDMWRQQESDLFRWARWTPVAIMALAAAQAAVLATMGPAFAAFWSQIGANIQAAQNNPGGPLPALPHLPTLMPLQIMGLLQLGLMVLMALWQYRAAHMARDLGLPARYSPGWGAWGWFIPVVQLWMPFRAMADLLPPGHPARRRMIWLPLAYLVAIPASWVALFIGVVLNSATTIVPALVVMAIAAISVAVGGTQYISAVQKAHGQMLGDRPVQV